MLGIEILHRLVIEQAVDRLGIGIDVAVVHRAADGDPPIRGDRREDHVGGDHRRRRECIAPVELDEEYAKDQQEFHEGRYAGQHDEPHDRLDRVAAALENARQAAGLALEMEAQGQPVHVDEDVIGETAHRIHRHRRKQPVTQLREKGHEHTQRAVKKRQRNRTGEQCRQGDIVPVLAG